MDRLLFIIGILLIGLSLSENIIPMLFTKVPNKIVDINDPKFTGGVEYVFTPLKLFDTESV